VYIASQRLDLIALPAPYLGQYLNLDFLLAACRCRLQEYSAVLVSSHRLRVFSTACRPPCPFFNTRFLACRLRLPTAGVQRCVRSQPAA
jgi:hypothetical protein